MLVSIYRVPAATFLLSVRTILYIWNTKFDAKNTVCDNTRIGPVVSFNADSGVIVCNEGEGRGDLTKVQMNAGRVLLLMLGCISIDEIFAFTQNLGWGETGSV